MDRVVRLVTLIVVLILVASGLIAFYTIFMNPSDDLAVPDFRELSIVEAVAEAEKLDLVIQVEPVVGSLPDGTILAQYPEPGEQIKKGHVIILQVSRTGELKAVPDLRKKTLIAADDTIKSSGFTLGDVIKIKDKGTPPGTVIAQNPAASVKVMPGRKIDLLVQEGTPTNKITIPDVNRLSEKEARQKLEASGIKIQGVERAYSPLIPEGSVIETKPNAGNLIAQNQGVILKLATQKRPAGFLEDSAKSNQKSGVDGNATVKRVTNQPDKNSQTPEKKSDTPKNNAPDKNAKTASKSENDNQVMNAPEEPKPIPKTETPAKKSEAPQNKTPSSGNSKTAKVRYQVPPLSSPMNLRIELTDPSGKRDIFNRQVKSGESVNVQAKYTQECVISIYLGGEFVWQERQR